MILYLLFLCLGLSAIDHNTTEIAWDLHGVVLHKDRPRMALTGVKHVGIITADLFAALACESITYCWAGEFGPTQKFFQDVWGHFRKSSEPEAYKRAITERDATLGRAVTSVDRIEDIEAEFTIIPGMQELITELSNLGYTQRIASNIGAGAYKRLAAKYPFFDNNLCQGQCVDFREHDTIRKPSPEFFKRYIKQYNPTGRKAIIFIDDNRANVQAAHDAGMRAILFTNPEQLRADLKKLGIPLL